MNLEAFAVAAAVLLFGCGTSKTPCDPLHCSGCCDATGTCQSGFLTSQCGANGASCSACSVADVCAGGHCVPMSGSGGGSSTGGGSAAGGGSGTGGGSSTGGGSATGGGSGTGGGGGSAATGNITFLWQFGSMTCAQAGVTYVQVAIPGQVLQGGGLFSCSTNGVDGVVLNDFNNGTYPWTLAGQDSAGNTHYAGTGMVTVNGDVTVNANLAATQVGTLVLSWTFDGSGTCPSNAPTLGVQIDQGNIVSVNCSAGVNGANLITPNVPVGSHVVNVSTAVDAGTDFAGTGSFTISTTQQTNLTVDLQPVIM